MEGNFEIKVKDALFNSKIGVGEQERRVGNEFRVNVNLTYPAEEFRTEELSSTISYADVYEIISEEMKKEWLLLESVAAAISKRVTETWHQVSELSVAIDKIAAPINGMVGECGIKFFWKKS